MTQYSGKVIRKTPVTPTQQSASGVWKLNEQAAAIRNNSWPVPGVPDPISRSVRLRSSASAYFNRTFGTPTNNKVWTMSLWCKRGDLGTWRGLFAAGNTGGVITKAEFYTDDLLYLNSWNGSSNFQLLATSQVFRDPSAWYHLVFVYDFTNATANNRARIYLNGTEITSFSSRTNPSTTDTSYWNNASYSQEIGKSYQTATTSSKYFDGYMTEVNFIDGQALTPSSFGTTDTATGAWIPMPYTGTYGANGFYLNFKDNTSTTTLGYDYSGNANNWTANNISLTAGATYDSMLDVPTPWVGYSTTTDTSAVTRGNYAVLNPLISASYQTISNANLTSKSNTSTDSGSAFSTISTGTTGLWYCEFTANTSSGGGYPIIGTWDTSIALPSANGGTYIPGASGSGTGYMSSGNKYISGSGSAYGSSYSTNDVVGIAIDCTNGAIYFSKNGTWQNSGVPTSGSSKTGAANTWTGGTKAFLIGLASYTSGNGADANFGQRPLSYSPPAGYSTLVTTNLPTPAITNGANYMAASTYTGNGSTQSIVNSGNNTAAVSFKPDLIWTKGRSGVTNHSLVDSVRGSSLQLSSNQTIAEVSDATEITAFNTNGFSVGNSTGAGISVNANGTTYVGWQWQAGAGTTSSNTSGSITSTVSVNTTAGFSVVTYTTASANATVGHGLGIAPNLIIVKCRNTTIGWTTYHVSLGNTQYVQLNTTAAAATDATAWNNTSPTSSVFSLGTAWGSNNYVAYCWAAVAGYSAFGSYTGNNSADGPFVYCGFRPRWIMFKNTTNSGSWVIFDTSRDTYNVEQNYLFPNQSTAENGLGSVTPQVDYLSNGFKIRANDANAWMGNQSGSTFIYAAFAENPFKYSNAR